MVPDGRAGSRSQFTVLTNDVNSVPTFLLPSSGRISLHFSSLGDKLGVGVGGLERSWAGSHA